MNTYRYNLKVIVLAAGKSKRFNGIKLLAEVKQKNETATLIQRVLHQVSTALKLLNIDESHLYVATGDYHLKIAELIGKQFSLGYCERAHYGIGDTIAQSVEKVITCESETSHIMIMLADQIALNADDYVSLIKQSFATPNKLICTKAVQEIMSPAIFPQQYFTDLINLKGDKGAKALLHKNKEHLQVVLLPNAAIDIDTQQDLINWHVKNH